ncbi:MAG: formate--tetrahydrofolate ligase [Erysipelotrichales bacterium]|nr:formate--tetrahydrofolate ligase [Erysipelotrichales bacterium]
MENIGLIKEKYDFTEFIPYGSFMGKVETYSKFGKGKVILVTATTPTKYGEGKTTVAIGLSDALNIIGKKAIANLREPSMGPVFGLKGGATGGGKAKILPENEINLHFTGDFHAITTANNLICAVIDNEIYHDNKLDIQSVTFNRCMDMNDRALRHIKLQDREESFNITAASEIMAIFCLAKDLDDLRKRLDDIIIGYNSRLNEIHLSALGITDALIGILSDAFKPNLVQTLEGNGALVHGGPFANIAHGCSSLVSLKSATNVAGYVVTEAGFGADAGAYKFMDILTRDNKFDLTAIVLVTTVRSLKEFGDGSLEEGIQNLKTHVNNLRLMNNNIVVTVNKFENDTDDDIKFIIDYADSLGVKAVVNTVFKDGGLGALDLAEEILKFTDKNKINYIYDLEDNLYSKIDSYVKNICHANGFNCSFEVMNKINSLDKYKYPICVAKTQYSLVDNKKIKGDTSDYSMTLTNIEVKNGAKLIVCYFGGILTMPGLNDNPSVKEIKIVDGELILPR